MERKTLKFIVKKEFIAWAPLVDRVHSTAMAILDGIMGARVDEKIVELGPIVQECIKDCQNRLNVMYNMYALSRASRKYVFGRFKKEFAKYARFFVKAVVVKSNLYFFAGHGNQEHLVRLQDTLAPMLDQTTLVCAPVLF
jgi:hypothetical protein